MTNKRSHNSRSKILLERSLSINENDEVESDTLAGEIRSAGVSTDDVVSFKVHVVSTAKDSKESDQIVDKSEIDVPKSKPSSKVENGSKPDIDARNSVLKQNSNKLHGVEIRSGNDSVGPQVRVNKSSASSNVDRKDYSEEFGKSKPNEQSGLKGDNKKKNINYQKNLGYDTDKEKVEKSIEKNKVLEKVKGDTEKDGVKGKVKDFVQIFNMEKPSIKTTPDIDRRNSSGRWRNADVSRSNSKTMLNSTKTHESGLRDLSNS